MLNEGYGLGKFAFYGKEGIGFAKEGWDGKQFEGCDI